MKIKEREMIYPPTASCHASTIDFYNNEPIIAWFGGQREGLPDSSIYIKQGNSVKSFGNRENIAYWNPILFSCGNHLYLIYKKGEFCDRWNTFFAYLTDQKLGPTLDVPLEAGLNFSVKTRPVIDKNGNILCGSSVETHYDWTCYVEQYSFTTFDPAAKTSKKEQPTFMFIDRSQPLSVPKKSYSIGTLLGQTFDRKTCGIIQPSLWIDKNDIVHGLCRSSRGLDKLYHFTGKLEKFYNNGEEKQYNDSYEWESPEETELDNPNSSVDTVYMNERLFLVHNPSTENRHPLLVSELDDDLNIIDSIEINDKADIGTGELSYPYLISHNNQLHLTYTYGRKSIEYCIISV